ncbi:unnamed protein product [Menidia menidia]|uniref:(Atlantic silverside) hypothetical protein n=1 Tax=Menidia menidia TaxID=238744 RepID=A0A8S4ALU3_9TELE|nr:unnamed protein product [Menidia menidia]
MEKKRWDCTALPKGWKMEEVTRKSGLSAGKSDVYYFSPSGKKFRSKPQLARYLGNQMDLSSFDFRTGKMLMSKLNKNRQRLRYDNNNQNKGKPDLNTSLPVRQTASIFKQPSHPPILLPEVMVSHPKKSKSWHIPAPTAGAASNPLETHRGSAPSLFTIPARLQQVATAGPNADLQAVRRRLPRGRRSALPLQGQGGGHSFFFPLFCGRLL